MLEVEVLEVFEVEVLEVFAVNSNLSSLVLKDECLLVVELVCELFDVLGVVRS